VPQPSTLQRAFLLPCELYAHGLWPKCNEWRNCKRVVEGGRTNIYDAERSVYQSLDQEGCEMWRLTIFNCGCIIDRFQANK
jgi:hypothetical protein